MGETPDPPPTHTIALVDDDRNILTSVAIGLQAEGYATRVYADGEAALKALLENPPTWRSATSRCRAWTGMNCCAGCAKNRRCQ